MVAKIICFFSCCLCAYSFFAMSVGGADRTDPINFFSGDESLKDKIKDLRNYNAEMSRMYKLWGLSLILVGVLFFVLPMLASLITVCVVGIASSIVAYKTYKTILKKYSREVV